MIQNGLNFLFALEWCHLNARAIELIVGFIFSRQNPQKVGMVTEMIK